MPVSADAVRTALNAFVDPLIGRGLVAAGAVKSVDVRAGRAFVHVELGFPAARYRFELSERIGAHLKQALGIDAKVQVDWKIASHAVQQKLQPLPEIRNIIAVASGKGGVGKSTVAANLALALQLEGAKVGMLDADIYGPSQPRMLGSKERPTSPDGKSMNPIVAHGIQAMSIGFLVDEEEPAIWRGPMVTSALAQL